MGFGVVELALGSVERVSDGGELGLALSESDLEFSLEDGELLESVLLVNKGLAEVFVFAENYNLVVSKSDSCVHLVVLGGLHLVDDRVSKLNKDVQQVLLELGP